MTTARRWSKGFAPLFVLLLLSSSLGLWAAAAEAASNRPVVMSVRGMVAAHHPLAAQAGLEMLKKGGNAVDAAVAANAVLGAVYPHMNGIGGDLFMLIYIAKDQKVYALNASGRSPYAMTRDYFTQKGLDRVPLQGSLLPVSVPGAVDGWDQALRRFGRLTLADVLQPAIDIAANGFAVTEHLARASQTSHELLLKTPTTAKMLTRDGQPFQAGDVLVLKDYAGSLRKCAVGGRDVFYQGELAQAMVKYSQENGGLLSLKDFADHRSTWVEPITTSYRGYTVYEFPPNTQGIALLQLLNMVEAYDLKAMGHNSAETLHLFAEAKKLAFADLDKYITDPDFATVPVKGLASKEYAAKRRKLIDPNRAATSVAGGDAESDTITLQVVDREGNGVSLIQSLYFAWGSGVVAGDTGILLQNRAGYFTLDPIHVNRLEPHKRTFHTLNPAMLFKDGKPFLLVATRGAGGQVQTLLSVITNMIDFGMNPQEAVEAARWLHGIVVPGNPPDLLNLEGRIAPDVAKALEAKGHKVKVHPPFTQTMGAVTAIMIDPRTGTLWGAGDPRADGVALGYEGP
ncbi:MAG: gamma-glutamyltransferase [Candidatus Entotheonellia bacterium]